MADGIGSFTVALDVLLGLKSLSNDLEGRFEGLEPSLQRMERPLQITMTVGECIYVNIQMSVCILSLL